MAQRARTASTTKTQASGAKRGRPPGSTSAKAAATAKPTKGRRAAVTPPAATRRRPAAAAPAPKVSKDELRAQVEKLERTVATLRARSREAVRAAKQATARIEELEAQLAAKPAATAPRAASRTPKPAAKADALMARRKTRARRGQAGSDERDPGDAVPPGVAVAEPEPMDEEATTAFENLQAHLHPADEPAGS